MKSQVKQLLPQSKRAKAPQVARFLIALLFFTHISTSPDAGINSYQAVERGVANEHSEVNKSGNATFGQLTAEERAFFESDYATRGARYYEPNSGRLLLRRIDGSSQGDLPSFCAQLLFKRAFNNVLPYLLVG